MTYQTGHGLAGSVRQGCPAVTISCGRASGTPPCRAASAAVRCCRITDAVKMAARFPGAAGVPPRLRRVRDVGAGGQIKATRAVRGAFPDALGGLTGRLGAGHNILCVSGFIKVSSFFSEI